MFADRLHLICDGSAELSALAAEIGLAYEPRPRCFRVASAGVVNRYSRFVVEDTPDTETLSAHLNRLIVRTAVAGVWPHFFECKTCGRFGISRRRDRRAFCPDSSKCRVQNHRRTVREAVRATTDRVRTLVRQRAVELNRAGMPYTDAWNRACEEHRLGAAAMRALIRGGDTTEADEKDHRRPSEQRA